MSRLAGRKALVTGGTRGIGRAIALRLREDGAEVHVTGTSPQASAPAGTVLHGVDFSDAAAAIAFAATVGGLDFDVLVNNAGINKIAPFAEIALDDFARIQQVNVTAPLLLMQAVLPGMRARAWGRIVNIASIWGKISKEQRASYSASKFALDGISVALAAEATRDGVLVNCVSPGFIDTELTRQVLGQSGIDALTAQVPARRLGTPEEVAAFVAWLAGPENTFIAGQNIAIDGGFTRV